MIRKPATRSRMFWEKRSAASTSFTWALSRNLRPPNFTKGMLRRVSSISSGPLWWLARMSEFAAPERFLTAGRRTREAT